MVMRMALGIVVVGALTAGCKQKAPPATETVAPSAAAAPASPPSQPPPTATAPSGGDDPCPAICERTRPLKCKRAAACRETCGQMRLIDTCVTEMAAVMTCFGRQPLSSWQCSEEGDAAMKDGFCDAQQGQFVRCIEHGAGAAHPSGTHL